MKPKTRKGSRARRARRAAAERGESRKVTLLLPRDLIERSLRSTGQSLTETVRQGLRLVAAAHAFRDLRALRGKVKFSVNLKELRED